jgi:type III pantothenate kinase
MAVVLALDRGNYSCKAALVDSGNVIRRWRDTSGNPEEIVVPILNEYSPHGVVVSSVIPKWTSGVEAVLKGKGVERLLVVNSALKLPFRLLLGSPGKVGADRIATASGVVSHGMKEAVIVDCGTAVTVDVLSQKGFLGGSIFPGRDLLLRPLNAGTALLPYIADDGRLPDPPGENTEKALLAGTGWGLVGAVRELVARSLAFLSPGAAVFLTGGGAGILASRIDRQTRVEPDLAMHGLYFLYELNGETRSGQ